MQTPFHTLANEIHHDPPMVSRSFKKDWRLMFQLNLRKVHIPAQIGCVSVTFEQCNEEVNVVLHLHRR
jgi:hypothetical protein